MGDGVLVYFGFPRAHEDDAERAVRAGLGIVCRRGKTRNGGEATALEVRIGIATGLVVVGELMGRARRSEQASSATRPILPRGCKPLRSREASWSRSRRGGCWAGRSS